MLSPRQLNDMMSLILLFGIIISTTLVFMGGMAYLFKYGSMDFQTALHQSTIYQTSIKTIFANVLQFLPFTIIEFGLLSLVITQILRVALLAFYYLSLRDYWFAIFSIFILCLLSYSLFWR